MAIPTERLLEILKLMLDKYFKNYVNSAGLCKVLEHLKSFKLITAEEYHIVLLQIGKRTGTQLDFLIMKYVWSKFDADSRIHFLQDWIQEVESKL